ncbi:DUF4189 domain-containing protein [Sphingomonas sp.]|uniref:DUF4189 domain-containing protein n=1 Tax=Sphingomonas sp. TaxID=28214 RepID=UPI003B3BB43B
MIAMKRVLLLVMLFFGSSAAFAQCAPGVPCGGNPMGVPPDQPNSPYNNGGYGDAGAAYGSQSTGAGGTWAAFAINATGRVVWTYNQRDARSAQRAVMAACRRTGEERCELIDSFTEVCGAPSTDAQQDMYMDWGSSRGIAEQSAIETCERKSQALPCRLVSLAICDSSDLTQQYLEETSRRAAATSTAALERISAGFRAKRGPARP